MIKSSVSCFFLRHSVRSNFMVFVVYDSCSTTECVSGDYSSEIRQENLANVKQERDDVCCVRLVYCNRNT